jgi:hypothetical protein
MTIPVYILGGISLVVQVYWSDRLKKRAAFIIASCIPVSVGYLMCVGSSNPNVGYAGMFVLVLGMLLDEFIETGLTFHQDSFLFLL